MKIFCERLKAERLRNSLTQQDMADKLKIPRKTYANYELIEKGHREPPLELVAEIAKILDVSTDYLFGLED